MCTAINIKTNHGDILLGRTMDFSFELDPQLYVVEKGYQWRNILNTHTIQTQYTFMGIGQDISPIAFADGVNEMGFAVATLYFPEYAYYDEIQHRQNSPLQIAAIELVKFLLGTCESVEDAIVAIRTIRIVGMEDSVTHTIAPLHWIMADKSGKCVVVEKMRDGLHIMDNTIGVLSNSPDFVWHKTNLRNYMDVTPDQKENANWQGVHLTPFGQGGGTFGIPGDYTPPSRFVRTAFQKSYTYFPENQTETVIAGFHIMESVSIPKGVVITHRDTNDYTQYTAFIDLSNQEYFFKSYNNSEIGTVKLSNVIQDNQQIQSITKINRAIDFQCFD